METYTERMQQLLLEGDIAYFTKYPHLIGEVMLVGHRGYIGYTDADLESELWFRGIPLPINPEAE
jgi:hypothetical protein